MAIPETHPDTAPTAPERRPLLADLRAFVRDGLRAATTGGPGYHLWMGSLTLVMLVGAWAYTVQIREGLAVTGMTDYVSWGLYISNFTFLVGLAAAAVMLVLPAYVLRDVDFPRAVLIGEGVAVGALVMCLAFVIVDLGGPHRMWHMIPFVGYFNWPASMLTWDVLVLNGYLALNVLIPFYILFSHYRGQKPNPRLYLPFVFLSVVWAFGIHLVTAFLYAGLPARPYWNSALLGPRFLASAFSAGPAFIIVVLAIIQRTTDYRLRDETFAKLALITTVAAQVNLVMLGSELFKEFYHPTEHSESAFYLFFGLEGHDSLVPWIWTALAMNVVATIVLTIHPLRRNRAVLLPTCVVLFVAIWIEKGFGLIVPGFIPSPWGDVVEYSPSWVEIAVTLGIWALGFFVLTALIRAALPIEMGRSRAPGALLGLLLLLVAVPAAGADPDEPFFDAGFDLRVRGEAWDAPAGRGATEQDFTFGLARARVGLEGRYRGWDLAAVLQGAAAVDLPERGSFGIGPVYTATNDGDTDPAQAGVAELSLGWQGDAFGFRAGRQGATEGFEVATGDAYLDGVKRARVAERLVGNWDWVNVGRRFDGLSARLDTGPVHWAGWAFRPLAGGVDFDDAFERLDDLTLYGLSGTVQDGTGGAAGTFRELRVGAIRYEDGRPGARSAALGDIEITTLVAHALVGGERGDRRWDLLGWVALQDGDWGPADHRAWAAFVEGGVKLPEVALQPALRAGVAHASGDGRPGGGEHRAFFNLLPTNHKWYGGIDFSAFSNLETAYAQADVALPAGWKATAELHTFRLADRDDHWWGGSGAFDEERLGYLARRPEGGFDSSHLGEEVDLTLSRALPHGFGLTVGGAWFRGGSAAAEVLARDEDGTWGFVQLTWKG